MQKLLAVELNMLGTGAFQFLATALIDPSRDASPVGIEMIFNPIPSELNVAR